jgi:SAM-dependent methyltransferase
LTPPPVEPVVTLPPCPDLPARDKTQKPDHVVQLVELSDAMTVVDLGSGDGYFLCRLSPAVGARGRVIATEVSKPLVRALEKRVAHEQLANVEVVHAPITDVGIAAASADRILLVKVWHHMRDRKRDAARISRAPDSWRQGRRRRLQTRTRKPRCRCISERLRPVVHRAFTERARRPIHDRMTIVHDRSPRDKDGAHAMLGVPPVEDWSAG